MIDFEGDPSVAWQWQRWLASQGWAGVRPKGILRFNLHDRIIHAAVAGQGIALGRVQIIGPMLADGRLIALPAPRPAPDPNKAYWLLQRDVRPVSSLIDWICNEARVTDSTPCECLRGCSPGPHTMKNAKWCHPLGVELVGWGLYNCCWKAMTRAYIDFFIFRVTVKVTVSGQRLPPWKA